MIYRYNSGLCGLQITFVQVTKRVRVCQEAKELNTRAGLKFECLGQHHFEPEVAEASPYEATSHAALEWMIEDAGR